MAKLFNRNQVEDVIAAYMAAEKHKAYAVVNLVAMTKKVKEDDGSKRDVTTVVATKDSVDWNRSSDAIKIYSVAKVRLGDALKPVKRFSFSEIHLTVNAAMGCKPASWLYRATFAYNTSNSHWYLYARRENGDFYARLDGELKEISAADWAKATKRALVYNDCSTVTGAYASAGNLKRHKLVMSCMNEAAVNHLERSIQATGGISLLYTNPARLKSAKAIAQANVRESAAYTASWNGPRIRVAAFFMGKWKLNDITTGERYDGCDGWFAANANMYRRWMEELGHEVMTEEAVSGIVGQERPFSFKGVSSSMPAAVMADMILDPNCVCHGAEVVVVRASHVTREEQDAFHEAIESKGKKGAFAGKTVVVIYDDSVEFDASNPASYEQVDVLGDLNAEKAEQDLTMPSYLNILKLFRKSKKDWNNGMGTSTQLLQSIYPVAPHLKALMRIGFRAQMGKSVEDITREEAKSISTMDVLSCIKKPSEEIALDEGEGMELTDAEKSVLSNNDYGMNVVNLAELLAPRYCWEKDAALFKDELKAAYKAGKSRADRVRVPINGTDFVLVPDFAALYGHAVLGVAEGKYEAYGNLLNQVGVAEGAMIKYPKQHCYEMSSLRFQSQADVAGKLAGNPYADKIAYLYATVSEAAMLCPAMADFMSQNAGLDFDGDDGFVTEVLPEDEYNARLAGIDWTKGWQAQQEYVKITIAYWMGRIRSLVVNIDADAEDKSAKTVNKKLAAAAASGYVAAKPNVTVDLDRMWGSVALGENMPSRKEIEAWGIMNPGNEASVRNIENANLDVGIVTVIHLVFSHLFFMLTKMENKADDELNADEQVIVDVAKAIMTTVFENKEVKGEKYTPFIYFDDESGLHAVNIDINEYHRVRESSRTMELTRDNMKMFFFDLIANARMAQEMTIDACKTLQIVANIEYAASLRKYVKILSRQEMDIDFAYGDKDSHVSIVGPKLGNETKILSRQEMDKSGKIVNKVSQIVVRDWAQDLRAEGYKAIVAAIRPLLNNKPGFDADLIGNLTDLATNYPEAARLADFFKVVYMHLNSAQEQAMREATENVVGRLEKELAKSEVRADHAGFFNGIGNAIRIGLRDFASSLRLQGLDADEVAALEAALLISLAYTGKKGNVDSKLSSFAYRVLPEEYMRFILQYVCADDDRVARYTEDALKWVRKDIKPGQDITFSDGKGYLYGDCVAEANGSLNGEYTILEENGRRYASTDVLNLMPLQKARNALVVETKLSEWMSSHMDRFLKEIAPDSKGNAATVQLWAKKTNGQDGNDLHDVIAVEDEDGAYGVGYFHVNNKDCTFDLYNGVRGQVTNVTVYTNGNGEKIAILLLENCENAAESQYVEPVFEDLPVDEGWEAPVAKAAAPKKFKTAKAESAAPEVTLNVKAVEESHKSSKFTATKLQPVDMDMLEDWDYGEAE